MAERTFWDDWSRNFPVTFTRLERNETAGMPTLIRIDRAGQHIIFSADELHAFLEPAVESEHVHKWMHHLMYRECACGKSEMLPKEERLI